MRIAFLLLAPVVLAACATVPGEQAGWASLGETVEVGDLHVKPIRVVEDSRCPAEVQCVWAGRVRIRTRIDYAASDYAVRTLTLGEPAQVAGATVELVEVEPAASRDGQIAAEDYRFRFR